MSHRVRWPALAVLAVLVAGCSDDHPPTSPDPEPRATGAPAHDLAWLADNAIAFRTAEPGGDDSDLMALKQIIGDARIVALGEATHGTREFFQMKHRVLEFLVREMGFNTFGIEAAWAESDEVNAYVQTGTGDPAQLLAGLHFWTWNTQEVLDVIHWMRTHNQAPGDARRVSFRGFDMQYAELAMDQIIDFVRVVDPGAVVEMTDHYDCWRHWTIRPRYYPDQPRATREECRNGLEAGYAQLAANQDRYRAVSSPAAMERALRAARIALQQEEHARATGVEARDLRDRFMADNVEWLLEQAGEDARIVLWAHNAHVMNAPGWMGEHLRNRYGDDLVIVGFSFHQGGFNAVRLSPGAPPELLPLNAPPARNDSYEHFLHQLGVPRFLVDLRPLRHGAPEAASWLRGPMPMRMIGAGYRPDAPDLYYSPTRLPEQYDVMIHFEHTTPSTLLPLDPRRR